MFDKTNKVFIFNVGFIAEKLLPKLSVLLWYCIGTRTQWRRVVMWQYWWKYWCQYCYCG